VTLILYKRPCVCVCVCVCVWTRCAAHNAKKVPTHMSARHNCDDDELYLNRWILIVRVTNTYVRCYTQRLFKVYNTNAYMTVIMEFVGCGFFALVFSRGSQHSSGGRAAWLTRFSPSSSMPAPTCSVSTRTFWIYRTRYTLRVYSASS